MLLNCGAGEDSLESLDCKEIKPVGPKGNQSWIFIGRTDAFYNGGATLTAEGSDSLEDLKHLEEQGVEILTCGTCLNYYGLSEKLQVGSVTNMYAIVEKMTGADKIIKP